MSDPVTTAAPEAAPAEPAALATAAEPAAPAEPAVVFDKEYVSELRSEAAASRVKAKQAAEALEATKEAIAKALGLQPDDDPAAQVQKTAAQLEAERQVNRNLAVENAVLRMAAKHGADPESLTDSRSFMRQLEAMDPAAADFAAQVDEAIKDAVTRNPLLRPAPAAPPARSGGPVGGGAPVPGQLDSVEGMSPAEIVKAKEEGRLNKLLGITG